MTHNTFAFWCCTLLAGVIIGIASQRIPEARRNYQAEQNNLYHNYCVERNVIKAQAAASAGRMNF